MPNKWVVVLMLIFGLFAYWGLKGLMSGDIKVTHDPNSSDKANISFSLKSEPKG
ncbi:MULTISPECIES: hypothetical protein [Citrobacter freundii complex]|uniref:hypothetical protein n=1 Tax=Citrobacter freundii complex TaxID=1344959 RepID=UPI001F5BF935|nr:hypothetical protein [Citrobacter braakii]MEB0963648.1 hypothetical protein [Citrobacter braakii]